MHVIQSLRRSLSAGLFATGLALSSSFAMANGLAPALVEQPFATGNPSFLVSISGGLESAESFSLGANATVTSISWWAAADVTSGWHVNLASSLTQLADTSNTVAGNVGRGSSVGQDTDGQDVFLFDLVLNSPLSLNSGNYFLYIWNDDTDLVWSWATSTVGDGHSFFAEYDQNFNRTWTSDAGQTGASDLSLQVRGERQQSIPEPGTLALIGFAGAGLALGRRRRSPVNT